MQCRLRCAIVLVSVAQGTTNELLPMSVSASGRVFRGRLEQIRFVFGLDLQKIESKRVRTDHGYGI